MEAACTRQILVQQPPLVAGPWGQRQPAHGQRQLLLLMIRESNFAFCWAIVLNCHCVLVVVCAIIYRAEHILDACWDQGQPAQDHLVQQPPLVAGPWGQGQPAHGQLLLCYLVQGLKGLGDHLWSLTPGAACTRRALVQQAPLVAGETPGAGPACTWPASNCVTLCRV